MHFYLSMKVLFIHLFKYIFQVDDNYTPPKSEYKVSFDWLIFRAVFSNALSGPRSQSYD